MASRYKEERVDGKHHQLPWLLLPTFKLRVEGNINLYNFTANQRCNFQPPLFFPSHYMWCGSSHGWLITSRSEYSSLILLNPLSGAIIHLPPIKHHKAAYGEVFLKVILSRDPSLGAFEVVACLHSVVAHLEYGDLFWTYSSTKLNPPFCFREITFYKDRILAVNQTTEIMSVELVHESSKKYIKIREVAPRLEFQPHVSGHFVVNTKGDLLLVYRFFRTSADKSTYQIFKLVMDSDGKLERVPTSSLGGESWFLGRRSCGVSVLASDYPGCTPNTIYCQVIFVDALEGHVKVEAFNLEHGTITTRSFPSNPYQKKTRKTSCFSVGLDFFPYLDDTYDEIVIYYRRLDFITPVACFFVFKIIP